MLERVGLGLGHRVEQMRADPRVGEQVREEHALVDLEALLVLLEQLALGVDRRPGREQVGMAVGRLVDDLGQAQRPAQAVRHLLVDRLGARGDPRLALGPRGGRGRLQVGHHALPSSGPTRLTRPTPSTRGPPSTGPAARA